MCPITMETFDVVIIGGGFSGLGYLKELRANGVSATLFDNRHRVGGTLAHAYDDAVLTTSSAMTSFSDFIDYTPLSKPVVWTAVEFGEYLQAYVDRFDLAKHMRFRHMVSDVAPCSDVKGMKFTVSAENLETHEIVVAHCNHVVVASGAHIYDNKECVFSNIRGSETFTGIVLHTSEFVNIKNPLDMKGRRMLVVGTNESAADVSYFCAKVAEQVDFSMRGKNGPYVPRYQGKYPLDMDTSRFHHSIPRPLRVVATSIRATYRCTTVKIAELLSGKGIDDCTAGMVVTQKLNMSPYNVEWPYITGCKSESFARAIAEYGSRVRPGICHIDGDTVVFRNGTREKYDVIMLATGYKRSFPFLKKHFPKLECDASGSMRNLFKNMLHPDYGIDFAFGGFVRPSIGAIPPLLELQARYFALLCSGKKKPLEKSEILEIIAYDKRYNANVIGDALRDYVTYADEMASLIGCNIPFRQLFWSSPSLWMKAYLGPNHAGLYRLQGPGAKPEYVKREIAKQSHMFQPNLFVLTIPLILFLAFCGMLGSMTFRLINIKSYDGRKYNDPRVKTEIVHPLSVMCRAAAYWWINLLYPNIVINESF